MFNFRHNTKKRRTLPISTTSLHCNIYFLNKHVLFFYINDRCLQEFNGFHSFHVFDCEDALNKLRSQDYECTSDVISNFSFKLQITSNNTKKSNVFSLIKATLKKRYNEMKKSLDLSNFVGDKCMYAFNSIIK